MGLQMNETQAHPQAEPITAPLVPSQYRLAVRDIMSSLSQPRLWANLAWRDIVVQFERSLLGPFWMTLQAAAWIGAIVFVFGGIMGPHKEYAVYVAIGIVLYNYITVIITDSSDVFIRNRIIIHSHPNPYFAYVLRQVNFANIQLVFQSLIVVVVFAFVGFPISMMALLAILGMVLCVIMSVFLALIFSLLGLRWGDFRFGMLAIMRLGLFVTPILWTVEGGGWLKQLAANVNPMAHFINIVRMPLMGELPPMLSYYVVFGCIIAGVSLGGYLFVHLRRTISMWL